MFETALLALDLSPAEAPILGCMPALRRWGVERLVVVHVIRVGYAQGPTFRQDEETAARLEAEVGPLRAAGVRVEIQVRTAVRPPAPTRWPTSSWRPICHATRPVPNRRPWRWPQRAHASTR